MLNVISNEKKILIDVINSNVACINVFAPSNQEITKPLNNLYVSLSYFDEKEKYSWKYKAGMSDGKVYLFDRISQTFALGLTAKVHKILKASCPDFKIELSKEIYKVFSPPGGKVPAEQFDEFVKSLNLYNNTYNEEIVPRDYQLKMFYDSINTRKCSLQAATSSGKSLSIYLITRWLYEKENKDVLIVVPSMALVEQIYLDFKNDYNWKDIEQHVSKIHSEVEELKLTKKKKEALIALEMTKDDLLKRIVITTWQSLLNKEPKFFERFGAVIVDEAHGSKSFSLQTILHHCKNATLKVGLSGTIPESGLDGALIEGALGDKKLIIKSKELIDLGLSTPVQIYSIIIPYTDAAKKTVHKFDFAGQVALCGYNGSKSEVLKLLIESGKITKQENSIILFKYLNTLKLTHDFIKSQFLEFKCIIYNGSVSAEKREEIRKLLESDDGYLVFATYGTMKQGINIKRVHNLVLAESSKSLITVIQSIGRLLRKFPGKTLAKIFDIVDDCSYWTRPRKGNSPTVILNYAMQHYEKRKEYYSFEEFPLTQIIAPMIANVDVDMTNALKGTKIVDKETKRELEKDVIEDLKNRKSHANFFDDGVF